MTTYRVLHVTYTDGRAEIVATEPDTPEGRKALEAEAWRQMYRGNVASCETITTTRHTMRKGTVR